MYIRNAQVNSVQDAATLIYDALTAEGWTVTMGSQTELPMKLAGASVNFVRPYLLFSRPSFGILRLNGDAIGDGSSLSTNRDWQIKPGSRLWMAADEEACCIYIKTSSGNGIAYHAGALERADPNDGWAWAVGTLTTEHDGNVFQIAQKSNSTERWVNAEDFAGAYKNIFVNSIYDSDEPTNRVTGTAILGPYFRSLSQEFRGTVKFAVTGLAGAAAGTEYEQRDPDSDQITKIYVATGVGAFEVFSA